MVSVIGISVWHGSPLFAILFLAALRRVPADLLDAATVDGAGGFQRLGLVILPHLWPALILGFVLSLLGTFGDFAIVEIVTRGGPLGATQTLPTLAFETLLNESEVGQAAAISLSFLPIYAVGIAFLARQIRR